MRTFREVTSVSVVLQLIAVTAVVVAVVTAKPNTGRDTSISFEALSNESDLDNSQDQADYTARLYAGYSESYITKEAARILKRLHKKPYTNKDYEDLLQDIMPKSDQKSKATIHDKKYFDYLPAEDGDEQDANLPSAIADDASHQTVQKRINNRRFRRDTAAEVAAMSGGHHGESGHQTKRQTDSGSWYQKTLAQQKRQSQYQTPASTVLLTRNTSPFSGFQLAQQPQPFHIRQDQIQPFIGPYYLPVPKPAVQYPPSVVSMPAFPQSWMSYPLPVVYYNPAFPLKNPLTPNRQPVKGSATPAGYLPPKKGTAPGVRPMGGGMSGRPLPTPSGNVTFDNRLDVNEEDRFVFDSGTPPPPRRAMQTTRRPSATRPPYRPNAAVPVDLDFVMQNFPNRQFNVQQSPPNRPPLINSVPREQRPQFSAQPNRGPLTSTASAPNNLPPLLHNSDYDDIDDMPSSNSGGVPSQTTNAPVTTARTPARPPIVATATATVPVSPTTARPPTTQRRPPMLPPLPPLPSTNLTNSTPRPNGPPPCVWAIINCCTTRREANRYQCFERLGCSGPIWDQDPCSDVVVDAAIEEGNKFYDTQ